MRRAIHSLRALPLLCAFLSAASLSAQVTPATPRSISVSGAAELSVTVDEAWIPLLINTEGPDLDGAKKEHERVFKDVRALVSRMGIADSLLDIDYLDVSAQQQVSDEYAGIVQRYKKDGDNNKPKTVGYDATRHLVVRLRNLSKLEELQQGLVKIDEVSLGSIQYNSAQLESERIKARLVAIRNAREKANMMASELGAKVGKPISISEFPSLGDPSSEGSFQAYMVSVLSAYGASKGDEGSSLYRSFHQIPISVQVLVVFELE